MELPSVNAIWLTPHESSLIELAEAGGRDHFCNYCGDFEIDYTRLYFQAEKTVNESSMMHVDEKAIEKEGARLHRGNCNGLISQPSRIIVKPMENRPYKIHDEMEIVTDVTRGSRNPQRVHFPTRSYCEV